MMKVRQNTPAQPTVDHWIQRSIYWTYFLHLFQFQVFVEVDNLRIDRRFNSTWRQQSVFTHSESFVIPSNACARAARIYEMNKISDIFLSFLIRLFFCFQIRNRRTNQQFNTQGWTEESTQRIHFVLTTRIRPYSGVRRFDSNFWDVSQAKTIDSGLQNPIERMQGVTYSRKTKIPMHLFKYVTVERHK